MNTTTTTTTTPSRNDDDHHHHHHHRLHRRFGRSHFLSKTRPKFPKTAKASQQILQPLCSTITWHLPFGMPASGSPRHLKEWERGVKEVREITEALEEQRVQA